MKEGIWAERKGGSGPLDPPTPKSASNNGADAYIDLM